MSIREHIGQDGKLYIRVRKYWDNKEYQKYIPAEKDKATALKKAEKLEQQWSDQQQAYRKQQQSVELLTFAKNGRIIGLNLQVVQVKNRRPVDEFKIRINNPETKKINFGSVSINEHGFDKAFKIAIEKICMFREIGAYTQLKKRMLNTKPLYEDLFNYE